MKPIRIGLIGCGRISQQHLLSIRIFPQHFTLAMTCDIVAERAEVADGIPHTTDYREILGRQDIDLVAICTPNGLHYEMGIATAEAGKHAIIEKPLTIASSTASELVDAFRHANRHLFPVLQVRYNPPIQAVRTLMKNSGMGKVYSANLIVAWSRPQKYYEGWRGTKSMDGGSLLNQGIHYLDAMMYLLGPVKSVMGDTATLAHDIEIEDHASAILQFESGAIGTMVFTVNAPRNIGNELEIIGEHGIVTIGGTAMDELSRWEVKNAPQPRLIPSLPPNIYAGGIYQGSCPNHPLVYEAVAQTLLFDRGNPVAKDIDAVRAIRIIEAIYASSVQRREIVIGDRS